MVKTRQVEAWQCLAANVEDIFSNVQHFARIRFVVGAAIVAYVTLPFKTLRKW